MCVRAGGGGGVGKRRHTCILSSPLCVWCAAENSGEWREDWAKLDQHGEGCHLVRRGAVRGDLPQPTWAKKRKDSDPNES